MLQFLSASVMEEAGSVANPLADQQGDFRWLGDESGRLAPTHHRSVPSHVIRGSFLTLIATEVLERNRGFQRF